MLTTQPRAPVLTEVTLESTATRIVTFSDASEHIGLSATDDQDWVERAIDAATRLAEEATRKVFIQRAVTARWWTLESTRITPLRLPRGPHVSLTAITSYEEGDETDEDESVFYVTGKNSPILRLKDTGSWGTAAAEIEEVQVVYEAGFGDAATDVPDTIKQAVLVTVADWYDDRTTAFRALPAACHEILSSDMQPMIL